MPYLSMNRNPPSTHLTGHLFLGPPPGCCKRAPKRYRHQEMSASQVSLWVRVHATLSTPTMSITCLASLHHQNKQLPTIVITRTYNAKLSPAWELSWCPAAVRS